jgi:hypothetical protein
MTFDATKFLALQRFCKRQALNFEQFLGGTNVEALMPIFLAMAQHDIPIDNGASILHR